MRAWTQLARIGLIGFVSVMGCGAHEGDEPGECTDGADNDRDGFFDCDDQDCVFSPDCDDDGGGGGGGDTDDGGGGGEDPPDPKLLELEQATIAYTLQIDFDLPVFGVEDCDMIYAGTGTSRADAAGSRVTFLGTWQKTGGSCPSDLDPIIWTPSSGVAYQTFIFTDGLGQLQEWHAHEREDAYTADDSSKPHWFMTEMGESYDHSNPTVRHQLAEPVIDIQGTLNHDVTITFTK